MNPETISVGIITTVVGMGVVFSVLVLLAFLIALLAKMTSGKKTKKDAPAPAPAPALALAPVAAVPAASQLSPKTVAAIMAAISAATGKPVEQLKFTAIKRVHGTQSSWANAGTSEIINTRQNYL